MSYAPTPHAPFAAWRAASDTAEAARKRRETASPRASPKKRRRKWRRRPARRRDVGLKRRNEEPSEIPGYNRVSTVEANTAAVVVVVVGAGFAAAGFPPPLPPVFGATTVATVAVEVAGDGSAVRCYPGAHRGNRCGSHARACAHSAPRARRARERWAPLRTSHSSRSEKSVGSRWRY